MTIGPVQREHINQELWLHIADDLLVKFELEINSKIYKIVLCMPSLTRDSVCEYASNEVPN